MIHTFFVRLEPTLTTLQVNAIVESLFEKYPIISVTAPAFLTWETFLSLNGKPRQMDNTTKRCYCDKLESLSVYYVYYLAPDDAQTSPSNFVRRCGAFIHERKLEGRIYDRTVISRRQLKCFTIADAFRIVEWEQYKLQRPIHRVLEMKNGSWEEIIGCTENFTPEIEAKEYLDKLRAARWAQLTKNQ
jgi:hypothetical protein